MSYRKAEELLPKELLEEIQQYVDGRSIYIPRRVKQEWGSGTSARSFFCERNRVIYEARQAGVGTEELAQQFSLSEKSIQRIIREQRRIAEGKEASHAGGRDYSEEESV